MKALPYSILLCVVTLVNSLVFSQESYLVKVNGVNVRETPSLNGKIIGTLSNGDIVSVINDKNPEWFFISIYGYEGYIASKLLIKLEETEEYKDWEKQNASTGDKPDCENIMPQYSTDLDNKLLINVGKNSDVIVKLMNQSNTCIRIAYIKASESFAMINIPEGVYYLKIAYGKDFRKDSRGGKCIVKFLVNPVYKQGSDKLDFYKVKKPNVFIDGDEYENWELPSYELSISIEYGKGGSTFRSNKITEEDFNR